MVLSLAARPVISAIPVLGLQKGFLVFEVFFLPLKFFSLYLGVFFNGATVSVALYSVINSVFYIFLFLVVSRKLAGILRSSDIDLRNGTQSTTRGVT